MSTEICIETLGHGTARELLRASEGSLSIGREPENSIVVDSSAVSRRHGCLLSTGSYWVFKDFDSSNGSWVNGKKLSAGQICLLRHGDVIQVADFAIRVRETTPRSVEQLSAEPPMVLVFCKESFELEYPLAIAGATLSLGGPDSDFAIEGANPDVNFLQITRVQDGIELIPGESSEGIYLNGQPVKNMTPVFDRDEILIPPYRFVLSNFAAIKPAEKVMCGAVQPSSHDAHLSHEAEEQGQSGDNDDAAWVSESARRKSNSAQKFVFSPNASLDDPMSMTTHLSAVKDPTAKRLRSGYEISSSRRFTAEEELEDSARTRLGESILIAVGVVIFILIVVALIYIGVTFSQA